MTTVPQEPWEAQVNRWMRKAIEATNRGLDESLYLADAKRALEQLREVARERGCGCSAEADPAAMCLACVVRAVVEQTIARLPDAEIARVDDCARPSRALNERLDALTTLVNAVREVVG